jgi:polyhydroxybutyrate depolymerase
MHAGRSWVLVTVVVTLAACVGVSDDAKLAAATSSPPTLPGPEPPDASAPPTDAVAAAHAVADAAQPESPEEGGAPVDDAGDSSATDAGVLEQPPPPPPPPPPPCGSAPNATGFVGRRTLSVAGVSRTYELFLPPGYDGTTRYPVVLVFHGDGGTGASVRAAFPIEAASSGGAVIAYPDGLGKTWQIDAVAPMARDVAFVDALVTELQGSHCGDGRSFLTGISRGAYFVNQVACHTSVSLRGVASHAGGGPFGILDREYDANGNLVCPSPPVAALQVHGTSDGVVSLSEGQASRDHWRRVNACTTTTTSTSPSPCVAYTGCARPEVWCAIPGLAHAFWSQAATTTWSFFAGR